MVEGCLSLKIGYKSLIAFMWLIPLTQLFSFLLAGKPLIEQEVIVDYSGYVLLLYFLFMAIMIKQSILERLLSFSIILFYSFYFTANNLSGRVGYILPYVVTIQLFWFLPRLIISKEDLAKIEKQIYYLFCFIVLAYLATINEHFESGRIYYDGFIIPHMFVYYLSIFSYYFSKRKNIFLLLLISALVLVVGTRTGIILTAASIYAGLGISFKWKNIPYFILSSILIFLGYLLISYAYLNFSGEKQLFTFLDSFEGFSLKLDLDDQESSKISSGRNLLLLNGLSEIQNSTLFINLIGRGPRSSYDFNDIILGLNAWFHNDFMEILFAFGILGLVVYVISLLRFSYLMKSKYILFFIIFSAFVNGFFFYSTTVILAIFVSASLVKKI